LGFSQELFLEVLMKKMLFPGFICFLLLVLLFSCQGKKSGLTYPDTAKGDQVDNYHGKAVSDPYRWLEDDRAPEVEAWVTRQNALTFDYLSKIPYRQEILKRLQLLYNYPRYGMPMRVGEYTFFSKNDGLQNQNVYYFQKGFDGVPEIFIDPNTLSADGTVRVSLLEESQDKRYMAISRGESGSDWSEIRVMDIATRQELPDRVKWVKFSGAAWHGDGFFYSRYDAPREGTEFSQKNSEEKVFYHKLGDDQEKDVLVYQDPAHPLRYYRAQVTEDKRFLVLSISEGTHGTELLYRDLTASTAEFSLLCPGFEFDYSVINTHAGRFIVHSNFQAPNYRVLLIDPANPGIENWVDLVKEGDDVMESVSTAGGKLFCSSLHDVSSRISRYSLTGEKEGDISLPTLGSAYGFYGELDDLEIFYSFSSFTYPPTIYRYNIASGQSETFRKTDVPFDPEAFETRQVFYESKDKTRVPLFLVYKKGLNFDGKRPTYLYAYGGFNISMTPSFSPSIIPLLEQGGVYAMANIRGGGEYGEQWHQGGMLEKKQTVFDDFIAAAEYLIKQKITECDYLAISGGSNGGLLVGAVMVQRPELFKVALPAVGVLDMLRFHKFTVGWGWAVEYGSSDNPEQFKYLYAYSPLHNIKAKTAYPATMVTTADHDDRVVPAHSFKFIAALQAAQSGPNPVLIRIETRSGHGASSLTKSLEYMADTFAFMFHNMGIDYKPVQ